MCCESCRNAEETSMQRETMEIRAVWKDRPSWFASGTMQWVAQTTGTSESQRVREAPAFPIDERFIVSGDEDAAADAEDGFIRIDCSDMDEAQRQVVETMLADFAASLERDGWVRTGVGSDWFNLQFERTITT